MNVNNATFWWCRGQHHDGQRLVILVAGHTTSLTNHTGHTSNWGNLMRSGTVGFVKGSNNAQRKPNKCQITHFKHMGYNPKYN